MLEQKQIQSLPQLTAPVLTAYLDTNPANPRNQGLPPGYLTYLKSRGQVIAGRGGIEDQKLCREQLKRVEDYLRREPPRTRGVLVVAGPKAWDIVPLQVEVEDELHWGRPSLTQLLWLQDEHRPCGAVLVDRSGARFYRLWMGEAEEQKAAAFVVDTSKWRRKDLVPPAHPGLQKTRGSQRDVFEQRIEAQYSRFFRDAADRLSQWGERERLEPVILAGQNEVVEPVWSELPRPMRSRTAMFKSDLGRVAPAELYMRLEPSIQSWKREHDLKLVREILELRNGSRAVVGMDETLSQMQLGAARQLIVLRGLGGKLLQCTACGWADRAADRECPYCGSERHAAALRAVIPELARKYGVPVHVVSGEAAQRLREAGGMGAWL